MKAWLAKGVVGAGAGLGKMDVLVVPRQNGNSLVVNFTTDGRVWVEDEEHDGQPGPDDPLTEVNIPEELTKEIDFSFDLKGGDLTPHAKSLLSEFIASVNC